MKNKLKYLTKISLNKKIKTKWFVIANVCLLFLIVGLINADSIVKFFGGDFNKVTDILVIDNTNENLYNDIKIYYEEFSKYVEDMSKTKINLYEDNIESAKEIVKKDDSILLVVNDDLSNFINAEIIVNNNIDPIVSQLISTSLNTVKTNIALKHYNISESMLETIDSPVVVEKTNLDSSKSTDEMMDLVMGVAFPVMILPFFMLTIFLVQMIGAEINEEKTTKGMEIIISNVSPRVHFFSKLIASNLFVLIQGALLFIDVVIAIMIRIFVGNGSLNNLAGDIDISSIINSLSETGFLDNLVYIIPITLILMLLTFIAYSLVAGILASMTTNIEDYQQVQAPIIIISLVGYYLSMIAAMFDGSIIIRILSYIPFISALLSPALLVLGQIGIIDILVALVILIVTIYILFKYGLRIYKVGILNYSSSGLWKKMFKAVKEK